MTIRQITELLLIFNFALLTIYDLWVIRKFGPEPSISVVLYESSCRYPVIPFLLGFLAGHIMWPVINAVINGG